jgi:hypothetical protein
MALHSKAHQTEDTSCVPSLDPLPDTLYTYTARKIGCQNAQTAWLYGSLAQV